MPAPAWETRWKGRLEWEFQALRDAGIEFEPDEDAWEKGVLRLNLQVDVNGQRVSAIATYPEYFPDFRPRVQSDQLGLSHHQNPFSGELCLLGRASDQWQPEMALADLLTEMLPQAVAVGTSEEAPASDAEDVQAEPFSAYYDCIPGSAVLVDSNWAIPEEFKGGTLLLGLPAGQQGIPDFKFDDGETFPVLRGAVLEVRSEGGRVLAACDPAWRQLYRRTVIGRWIRRAEPLREPRPSQALQEAAARLMPLQERQWERVQTSTGTMRVLGILFPEETAHRETGWGWVFGVERVRAERARKDRGKKQRAHVFERGHSFYARAVYAGRADTLLRIPALAPLSKHTVAIFGLGSLGAPAAIELARAGLGELRVLDADHVEAGPTVRWPLGMGVVGDTKVDALTAFIREHYPYTAVRGWHHHLGVPQTSSPSDAQVLAEMLEDSSLILDATAEADVQRLMSRTAIERGIPYVAVVGKPGAWGGTVFRQLPGRACWHCLLKAQDTGTIPHPPGDPAPGPQARGCGEVTFTGAGFDMATLALDAVRTVVGTLCDAEGGYPAGDWNVAIISFRAEDGAAIPPKWEVFKLDRNPACEVCGAG